MQKTSYNQDVVVVGGGLAGLAVTAYLARGGLAVTLLERSAHLGGRARTRTVDGYCLNLGAHALYRAGEAAAVYRELGVPYSGGVPNAAGLALRNGRFYRLPVTPLSLLQSELLSVKDKTELALLMARLPRIEPGELDGANVTDWLARAVARPNVRELVLSFVRLTSFVNAPETFAAATAVRQLQIAAKGVLYVDGGWQTLCNGLRDQAARSGAVLVTDANAKQLHPGQSARRAATANETGAQPGVEVDDGRFFGARSVVLAMGPRDATRLLETAGTPLRDAEIGRPVLVAALDVALDRLPNPRAWFVLGIDQPIYLSVQSNSAHLVPPGGGAVVHLLKYLGTEPAHAAAVRAELESVLDLAQPGWRATARAVQFLPNMTAACRLDTAADARPDVEATSLPGVYLCGDWVAGQSAVPAALAKPAAGGWLSDAALGSARAVALRVLARHKERAAA
jgi:phytoene dehydrogenase-like protein